MILDELGRAAGMLLVFGGIDDRTARYAVGLLNRFSYGMVGFSDGLAGANDVLETSWSEIGAEHFYRRTQKPGSHKKCR